ncbi:MAG: pirin-like C-terminal cupin domain-containing protein [Neisseria sp.]|nr:pirin-like C-terminal cupin domain-containing protein [Neisseria sp.]
MTVEKHTPTMKDVGGIPVARLLPKGARRTIGAWCFLDHIGPVRFADDSKGLQVGSHPHTNLSTFTWMLEGEQLHGDSLGNRFTIGPKQVGLMTAGGGNGHGICHTEQTPEYEKNAHAVQLWIALPPNRDDIKPAFEYHSNLPEWQEQGASFILTTGTFQGRTAPTTQHSPIIGVDIRFNEDGELDFPAEAGWEYGALVIAGQIETGGETFEKEELVVITGEGRLKIRGKAGTHIMLLGGEPLAEPVLMWWNFVAYKAEDLQQAVDDWNNHHPRFGEIDLTGTGLKRLVAPDVPEAKMR